VLSKLYLVTRGALVPEMAAAGVIATPGTVDAGGAAPAIRPPKVEFAALNARLTLLGTLAGFAASVPGVLLLKLAGAPGVLVFGTFVFAAAALAGLRLPIPRVRRRSPGRAGPDRSGPGGAGTGTAIPGATGTATAGATGRERGGDARWGPGAEADVMRLQPIAHPEVLFGLTTMSIIRGLAGFLVFMLAFGLRRESAALWWYGLALGASGAGSLGGLLLVARLRRHLIEQQILLAAIWLIAVAAIGAAVWGTLPAQAGLALFVGLAGALAQPSFDAITQRFVPPPAQGRAFARFASRQQLVWVLGALIPVVVAFPFPAGDVVMAAVAGAGGLFYVTSRRALHGRALPRGAAPPSA